MRKNDFDKVSFPESVHNPLKCAIDYRFFFKKNPGDLMSNKITYKT